MKNIILFSILITSFSLNLFSQGDVSKARWVSSVIKIDGNDKDWDKPLNFYDENSGLMFAIGNDKENLLLCFTLKDEMRMKKLMSAGWTIGLSSNEKNKKFKSELSFPGVNVMGMRRSENNFEKKSIANNLVQTYLLQETKVSCKGFKSNFTDLTINSKENINIGIGADSIQHIVYEISIPLKELFASNLIHLNELITLNITVNALERPSSGGGYSGRSTGMGGGRAGGGMSGGMGGGRRGGGMSGGGMSGGMRGERNGGEMATHGAPGDRNSLFTKVSFKQKFILSVN